MTAILILVPLLAWLPGWLLTARYLFCRWRPSRVPLCGKKRHPYGGCYACSSYYHTHKACTEPHHGYECYRRRKADNTTVKVDSDSSAGGWAMFAGLAWPFVWMFLFLTASPPELTTEKTLRVEKERRQLADMITALEEKLKDAGIGE